MFKEDEGMFYRKMQRTKQKRGEVPKMEKNIEEFWAGIWKDNTKTPHRHWMNTVANKIGKKVTNVQEFTVTEKKLHETVNKRKITVHPQESTEYKKNCEKGLQEHGLQY